MSLFISMLIARGLSSLAAKVVVYGALALIVVGVLLGVRQHYIDAGWNKAMVAVKKQNDRAADAADHVQQKTDKCNESNGFWDVITQNCKLGEER